MKKILNIVGARPQFIKAFITMKSLNNIKSSKNILLHTGQHFDYSMSKIFFKELNFQNTLININLKEKTNRLIRLAEIIKKLTNKIKTINPDLVIVYGDTDTTLAGSIISKRLNIKLMHIEAGLRSNVIEMPEEQNRIFTDHLSDYLVCPNKKSLKNCLSFQNKKYFNFGDVMYDSFIFYNKFINKKFILNFKKKK